MNTRGRPRHPEVLTPRQQEVLALLRRGLTNEEIARELNISPDGVKFHVSDILRRLHVESRHEAAAWQPEPARPRWAMALAPIFALKKLHLGALGYAAAAVITGGAAIGVALLVWGVVRTSGHTDTTRQASGRTGIPEVDRAIDLLVHQDVDGLMQLVQFGPIGCSVTQTVGSPPPCAPGQPEGAPVDVFHIGFCEGTYATSADQVRQAFGLALLRQPSAAVFAVVRDNTQNRTEDAYWIAITQDRPSQGTADVSFWNINSGGKLVGLQSECGPVGAAQQVAYRFPADGHPDFVLGPFINCSPPPGQTANFMVAVDGLSPGGVLPQFWGEAKSTLGEDTGERAIVTVRVDTAWTGDIDRLEDVRVGMELEAVGVRQPDCTIVAQRILTPAPNTLHSDALRIELQYPFNWHEGATAMPYASCAGCTVLGPRDTQYPYGVSIFDQPLSPGCTASCYCGIRCTSAGADGPRTLPVAGIDASQLEVLRQPPVGLTNETGETTPYHEIWTLVPRSDHALLLVWFYRDGDAVGERYVRRSMETMLQSLALLTPSTPVPTSASCPVDTSTVQTQITGPIYQPPPGSSAIFDRLTLVAEATAVGKDGRPYSLYFGNLRGDPAQWVIVRWRGAKDPCAEGRPDYDPELLPLPFKASSVALEKIDNGSVYFGASSGERGSFDYTNAVFSTTPPP